MTARFMIAIPALNAGGTLAAVLRACSQYGAEIVVVNDGSTDDTGAVAKANDAHVLTHTKNRGKGAALKTAFAYALEKGYDAVVTLDADGQHLPQDIPALLATWDATGADLVIGGRSHLFSGMLARRRMANQFSAWIIGKMSRTGISDSQSGFRLYSARLLRAIRLRSDGFDLESEVIVRAGLGGFPIAMTRIDLGFVDGVSTSHYKPLQDTLRIAWAVCRARLLWR
jgi:glycosyltransferase involved in cell wall biosynthesis